MKIRANAKRRMWVAGLLGAAVLAGSPLSAQADQGKWWDPQQGGDERVRRDAPTPVAENADRGLHRGWRNDGPRFQRDVVVIREGRRGASYRAHRVWVRPVYVERRHVVVIRPVRYFVWADATIGGVHFRARIHDHDHYLYGCNFCDARFSSYGAYERHVYRCDDRPRGYRVEVSDWDRGWSDSGCDFDGHDDDYAYDWNR